MLDAIGSHLYYALPDPDRTMQLRRLRTDCTGSGCAQSVATLPNPQMHPIRHHPAGRTRSLLRGARNGHLTQPARSIQGADDSASRQVEQNARSLTLRARSLAHNSWSLC